MGIVAPLTNPFDEQAKPSHVKPEENKRVSLNWRKELLSKYCPSLYVASSLLHVGVGAALSFVPTAKNNKKTLVSIATGFTKIINSLFYSDLAIDAWKSRNTFDFISKTLEPILNCFSQLSNYHLLRGLGSAMTQLHFVNYDHVTQRQNLWLNFIDNLNVAKKFFIEAWTSPWFGSARKLFKFSQDKGHTLAFASHIQGATSIIGLLNGGRRNLVDKIVGTVRNVVGVLVDFELIQDRDKDKRLTGIYYLLHAIFDTAKRFVPENTADIIDNLIMPLYNAAMYHFGIVTRKQSNDKHEEEQSKLKPLSVNSEKALDLHVADQYAVPA